MKRNPSEHARHAATIRWARIGKKERSKMMKKLSANGLKKRWDKYRANKLSPPA